MKKLFVIALAIMTCTYALSFASDNQSKIQSEVQQDQCIKVGNVDAQVNENGYVTLYNHNNYAVNVNYTITALASGATRRITLNSGVKYITANNSAGFYATKGYSGYSISITVTKCN